MRLKAEIFPLYENYDGNSLLGLNRIDQISNFSIFAKKFSLDPKIEVVVENGALFETDGEDIFDKIHKHIERKISIVNRLIPLADIYLEIIKSEPKSQRNHSFKFLDERLSDSPKLQDFRKGLIDFELIEKIDARLFANCFSGREVDVKINWINTEVSLVHFVNRLETTNIIVGKEKWIALSNSFTLKSEVIYSTKISHSNSGCNLEMRKKLNGLINNLAAKPFINPNK